MTFFFGKVAIDFAPCSFAILDHPKQYQIKHIKNQTSFRIHIYTNTNPPPFVVMAHALSLVLDSDIYSLIWNPFSISFLSISPNNYSVVYGL